MVWGAFIRPSSLLFFFFTIPRVPSSRPYELRTWNRLTMNECEGQSLFQEKFHVSKILSKAGVRKGPGNKLAESASSFKSRESEDSAVSGSTEVKSTGSGNRLLDNSFYGDQQGREKLKVVVQGAPSESSVGRHHRSQRLQPLPEEYLSKQSRA